jgi:membrane-associated protein
MDLSTFLQRCVDVGRNIFDMDALTKTLSQPEFMWPLLAVVTLIVFAETGLLVGFFLPGDSLLVSTGLVWYQLIHSPDGAEFWTFGALMIIVCLAAIIGDTVGYWFGYKTGPVIFTREKSFFFAKDHLLRAKAFYERHGGKTIVLARFMPFIRTFAPIVAGVGKMEYRRFVFYNIFGGIGWVCSMLLLGYILTPVLDPALKPLLGEDFEVRKHIEKVIIVVVLLSISPGIIAWLRVKFKGAPKPEPAAVESR